MPALKAGSAGMALGYGALFGLLAYATYDLTNYATLRAWTLHITVIDLIYGAVAAAVTSFGAYHAARIATEWFGS